MGDTSMKTANLCLIFLLQLSFSFPSFADGSGMKAYQAGDYLKALSIWEPEAIQGNATAQFNIGYMHEFGEGVTQSHEIAAKWYELAADQGDARAQHSLGNFYFSSGSYAAATNWYKQSAEQGVAEAQADLGASYGLGQGVPQSYIYAHMWSNISSLTGFDKGVRLTAELEEFMSPTEISIAQYLARDCIKKNFKGCDTYPAYRTLLAMSHGS
tara:strand:- start:408 stop:1046 length:639 start_codon:yes stop_codon:yes gene_type:complete